MVFVNIFSSTGFLVSNEMWMVSFYRAYPIIMKKKNGLQIRRPILEKVTLQLYKNKQNRNNNLCGQGTHSKDLIKKKLSLKGK